MTKPNQIVFQPETLFSLNGCTQYGCSATFQSTSLFLHEPTYSNDHIRTPRVSSHACKTLLSTTIHRASICAPTNTNTTQHSSSVAFRRVPEIEVFSNSSASDARCGRQLLVACAGARASRFYTPSRACLFYCVLNRTRSSKTLSLSLRTPSCIR